MKYYILLFFIILSCCFKITAQTVDRKAFNEANTIRLYVSDSTKEIALVRFTRFIDKTCFTSFIPGETKSIKNEDTPPHNAAFTPKLAHIKQVDGSKMVGDTIYTNMAKLYDAMMGDFTARLKYYPVKDDKKNIYIAITGFVWNSNLGGKFSNLQMQKGGEEANWSQRAFFKQIKKQVSNYSDVNLIMYSDK